MTKDGIDGGAAFDFGRTSRDYARFRDIYPDEFYDRIVRRELCVAPQRVLDVGTGTGVLPRNLYGHGARWTATDSSPNQIAQAERLAAEGGMKIDFRIAPAEELDFADATFDVITACQCFWYFDHERTAPLFRRMLRPHGRLLVLYMGWLPAEDEIAAASEALVLKYNPGWTGAGDTKRPVHIPDAVLREFTLTEHEEYDLDVPFTRESWNGRMKTCRGIGASLPQEKIAAWEHEHTDLLSRIAGEAFSIRHYAALAVLEAK